MRPGARIYYATPNDGGIMGIILDRGPENYSWWIHRKDGSFDLIRAHEDDSPCDVRWLRTVQPNGRSVKIAA